MAAGQLKIATCQFAVSGSIKRNAKQICAQMQKAKRVGEICAFSGVCFGRLYRF